MSGKEIAKKLLAVAEENVKFSEDPKNREVLKVYFEPTDHGTVKVFVDSADKDGWAFEEKKFLLETCRLTSEEEQHAFMAGFEDELIGSTYDSEFKILNSYGNLFMELDAAMKKLETFVETSGENIHYFHEAEQPIMDYAEALACALFITGNGQCYIPNMMKFQKMGYDIFAGDKDSFGWLTGCIQKHGSPHVLVYG